MAAKTFLDDPSTPAKLRDLSEALVKAVDRDDRGHIQQIKLELGKMSTGIREEVRLLNGRANPDLLIALWSTAQMTFARGIEYASEGAHKEPTPVPEPLPADALHVPIPG